MTDYLRMIREKLPQPGEFREVFAFSIHKAGSTLMHKMIGEVCAACAIPAISIPDLMFKEGVSDEWQSDSQFNDFFVSGRVYYGFRNLLPLMEDPSFRLKERRAVLLVRDPRDALVSQYFSLGGKYISHKLPEKNKKAFLDRYKATAHLEIDEYVLQASNNYLGKLKAYKDNLNFDQVLLRHYEAIYFDKGTFLADIFSHFGLDVDGSVIRQVADNNDIRPDVEDITQHIRKGEPGDHREKLRPETIAQLNEKFREICQWYGYELES